MGNSPINILKYGTDWYREPVAQADGDRPEQADHHDGPCTVKDCQRCRAERAEARIADLEARVRRCHAILQDIVSRSDPSVYGEAMKELGGEFCLGACTTECDANRDRLEAENAALKAEIERWEDRTNP